jgi:hypothetical protein
MSNEASVKRGGVSIAGQFGVRRVRLERHIAVGCLALVAGVVLLDHVGSLGGFVAFVTSAGTAVRSFARAVDAGFGQFYGWVYGEPKTTNLVDRVAYRIIHRRPHPGSRLVGFLAPMPSPMPDGSVEFDEPKIRILAAHGDEFDRS